jgi:cyclase
MRRIIPSVKFTCDRRCVRTKKFAERQYLGDPVNILKLLSEYQADEISLLGIDAQPGKIDFAYIESLVSETFVPVAYGGGISSIQDCMTLNRLGVEKFILRTAFRSYNETLISQIIDRFGRQALVCCVDYDDCPARACATLDLQPSMYGELILQSVSRDGTLSGIDMAALDFVQKLSTERPVILAGGVISFKYAQSIQRDYDIDVMASSCFSVYGPHEAVLISYGV